MKPAYTKEYRKKYGSLEGVCVQLSFKDICKIAADKTRALTSDVPSFVRLNQTFGKNAALSWLYSHLKTLLTTFLVDERKFCDDQIDLLAETIITNHPTMKLTEFMLFESYFLAGRYKEFFGETSYILAITSSLQQFKKDLAVEYTVIEREQRGKLKELYSDAVYRCWHNLVVELRETIPEDHKKFLSGMFVDRVFEQDRCFRVAITQELYDLLEGEYYPLFLALFKKHFAALKLPKILYHVTKSFVTDDSKDASLPIITPSDKEIAAGCRSAHAVIDNLYKFDKENSDKLREVFRKRYGMFPEEYLKCYETKGGQVTNNEMK